MQHARDLRPSSPDRFQAMLRNTIGAKKLAYAWQSQLASQEGLAAEPLTDLNELVEFELSETERVLQDASSRLLSRSLNEMQQS